jgi:hypothetical protein
MFDDENCNYEIHVEEEVTGECVAEKSEVETLDGCVVLWVISWLNQETVADFVNGFTSKVMMKRVKIQDTYLIFDLCFDFSFKSRPWAAQAGD